LRCYDNNFYATHTTTHALHEHVSMQQYSSSVKEYCINMYHNVCCGLHVKNFLRQPWLHWVWDSIAVTACSQCDISWV